MSPVSFQGESAVLLVVEGSAAAPPWPDHLGAPPSAGWAVLEQEEWEPLAPFLDRMTGTLERDAASDAPTRHVVLVAGVSLHAATLASRHLMSLTLLRHLSHVGGGTLVMSHGHAQSDAACAELTAFARELEVEWADAGIVVATRFDDDALETELRKAG